MSLCRYVCYIPKQAFLGLHDLWLKKVFPLLACEDTIFEKSGFFPRWVKCAVLDQPTVDSGVVSRGRYVAVAVGRWLFALQWHLNSTSTTALQQHFHNTSTELQRHAHSTFQVLPNHFNETSTAQKRKRKKVIRAFIRIGQDIQCLLCVGCFF